MNYMYILGVETSCDETAAAVIKMDEKTKRLFVLSNVVASQIDIHKKYGGVIPEVAAREHVISIIPVIDQAIKEAKITSKKLNYIAVTKGPGLITSLMSGMETVRSLSYAWKKPAIEVNHIAGHIYANFINLAREVKFPAVILTVSGGHTNLVLMKKSHTLTIIGETLDDAAGEAYDKAAKMMGLGYPGGPIISEMATKFSKNSKNIKNYIEIKLPRPMINDGSYNFSFSGLKTALLYTLQKDKNWKKRIPEYCYYYQEAIIDVLTKKTIKAAKKYKAASVMLSGGVSANKELRLRLKKMVEKEMPKVDLFVPKLSYTTDNAAMIAAAGAFKALKDRTKDYSKLKTDPNWKL